MKRVIIPGFLSLIDILIVSMAPFLAVLLRFEGSLPDVYVGILIRYMPLIVVSRLVVFYFAGLYNRMWRYASIRELVAIMGAVSISSLVLVVLMNVVSDSGLPRSIHVLSWVMGIILVGASRFAIRLYAYYVRRYVGQKAVQELRNVLIIGAGDAGEMIAKELDKRLQSEYHLVGFVDDDIYKKGKMLHGAKVLGSRERIQEFVAQYNVDEIIIAMPSLGGGTVREIVEICRATQCELKTLPGMYELIDGKVGVQQLRSVQVEDLLCREPVKLAVEDIAAYLTGKRVLVTGAGGSIGSELCRQICKMKPEQLVLLGKGENSIYEIHQELKRTQPELATVPVIADVRDAQRVQTVFGEFQPQVVFHAAAHKHVPLMEAYPVEAVQNNIFGTKNVAEAADRNHSEIFIMISTDKAVNPTSVMGATKRVAEMVVQSMNEKSRTRYAAVRFGNVLGSRGSVVPLFKKQIASGGPVTITDPKMTRYFMTIPEASQLVLQAGALAAGGEVFVLDMGKPVKILDMAEDLIRLSGMEPYKDIDIAFCGLRPGEKLFEELLTAEEGTEATKHEKIFVAGLNSVSGKNLSEVLDSLQAASAKEDIIVLLQEIVPRYGVTKRSIVREPAQVASVRVQGDFEKQQVAVAQGH